MTSSNPDTIANELVRQFQAGSLNVSIYETKEALGRDAACTAVALMRQAIRKKGKARVLFSAANSQLDMVASLTGESGIDWNAIEVFHVDEYVGLASSHAASFGGWVQRNVVAKMRPGKAHFISGDAPDAVEECRRYAALLTFEPIDISFLGIGENGHIGFNDPHAADFCDPETLKVVTLDEKCRLQQVAEGHWPSFSSVPAQGFTITCPALMSAAYVICCVPGLQKAQAVRDALEGPVSTACPASVMRAHPDARLYLDVQSASLLARQV
jgi:glucosamine-6-phosphate deaminase